MVTRVGIYFDERDFTSDLIAEDCVNVVFFGRLRKFITFEYIGDDDGDVVASTTFIGGCYESVSGLLRVFVSVKDGGDFVVV